MLSPLSTSPPPLLASSAPLAGHPHLRHLVRNGPRRHAPRRYRRLPLSMARHSLRLHPRKGPERSDDDEAATLADFSQSTRAREGTAFLLWQSCERRLRARNRMEDDNGEVVLECVEGCARFRRCRLLRASFPQRNATECLSCSGSVLSALYFLIFWPITIAIIARTSPFTSLFPRLRHFPLLSTDVQS